MNGRTSQQKHKPQFTKGLLKPEEGSELKPEDTRRKFKGRVVFLGNNVKDQNWDFAVFQELSRIPCDYGGQPFS